MTEVPEHLLARSRARRAALGLGGDGGGGGGDAAPAAAAGSAIETADASGAVAATSSAAVAVAEAPPKRPEPIPTYVAASLERKRVPVWAMPVLAFLPLWAVIYAQTLSTAPTTAPTQLEVGATIYGNNCSSCHGGGGGGGAGRQLSDGEVVKTFPNIVSQLEFVKAGDIGFDGKPYGDPNRSPDPRTGGSWKGTKMPAWDKLTDAELIGVVRHERETLGGEPKDNVKVDDKGGRLWPNAKPMLNESGKLVWADGTPMFDDKGQLTKQVDPSKPAE